VSKIIGSIPGLVGALTAFAPRTLVKVVDYILIGYRIDSLLFWKGEVSLVYFIFSYPWLWSLSRDHLMCVLEYWRHQILGPWTAYFLLWSAISYMVRLWRICGLLVAKYSWKFSYLVTAHGKRPLICL